jgi:ParB-like chromosome segregation protein Spo0J
MRLPPSRDVIREWGWTNPVLVAEDGTIIAGHGRVLAARKLRITDVPVMIASDWTDAQKRAYAIADNKLTLNGGWDEELLGLELEELDVLGFDLDLIPPTLPRSTLAIGA